jgi:hypothetical protein
MFPYTRSNQKCLDDELNELVTEHGDPPPHELKDVKTFESLDYDLRTNTTGTAEM